VRKAVRVHGWSVESDLEILASPTDAPPEISIRLDASTAPDLHDPDGIGEELVLDQRPTWPSWLRRLGSGCLQYRVTGDYDVLFRADSSALIVRYDRSRSVELLAPLLAGGVLAMASTLRGRSCLHATTVAMDGCAVAIVGDVGAGKTTTAGLLIRADSQLIGDDILAPIELDGAFVAPRGLLELRFRDSAELLAHSLTARQVRRTADGRVGVVPTCVATRDDTPLACFVVPRLDAQSSNVAVRELSRAEAFRLLTASPRLEGWRDPAIIEQEFDLVARLATAIPVIELSLGGTDSMSLASADEVRTAIQPYLGTAGISSARAS
jgi:hypothetical protein